MKKVLIAYTTNAGSTEDVARVIAEEAGKDGVLTTVSRLEDISSLEGYDAVIVGAPMILGWHRSARKFIHEHRQELSRIPVAYFCTAMSLTSRSENAKGLPPMFLDPNLVKSPKREGRLDFKESNTLANNYLKPILRAAPEVKPVSVGFFGGKLELFKLKLLQLLFVMVIIGAQPADLRNWTAIREWASGLRESLQLAEE